jgi:hypothetical protein
MQRLPHDPSLERALEGGTTACRVCIALTATFIIALVAAALWTAFR